MQELAAEGKRNRRLLSSVATISRAAQQMAEDVMKEATVEASHRTDKRALRESNEALCEMNEAHERDISWWSIVNLRQWAAEAGGTRLKQEISFKFNLQRTQDLERMTWVQLEILMTKDLSCFQVHGCIKNERFGGRRGNANGVFCHICFHGETSWSSSEATTSSSTATTDYHRLLWRPQEVDHFLYWLFIAIPFSLVTLVISPFVHEDKEAY